MLTAKKIEKAISDFENRWAIRANKPGSGADAIPSVDKKGRYHAPHDGYEFEGKTFLAGEYLPDEGGSKNSFRTLKVKSFKSVAVSLAGRFSDYISLGKPWIQDGNELCYVYIKAPAGVINSLSKEHSSGKSLMLLEDAKKSGLKFGKPFKFYFKRAIALYGDLIDHIYPGWSDEMNKQEVAFVYYDDIIKE